MKLPLLLLTTGLIITGCTSAEKAEFKRIEQATVASVRSAAIMLKGGLAAVRANATTIEEALALANQIAPPGSDISKLDAEAQLAVKTIQASTDRQLVEQAVDVLIQHTR